MSSSSKSLFRTVSGVLSVVVCTAFLSCGNGRDPLPLDRWKDGSQVLNASSLDVTAGKILQSDGDYVNFRLTGEALTRAGGEAELCFHTQDG